MFAYLKRCDEEVPVAPYFVSKETLLARIREGRRPKPGRLDLERHFGSVTAAYAEAGVEPPSPRRPRPPEDAVREVVRLREEGLTFREIGQRLDMPLVTASRWYRSSRVRELTSCAMSKPDGLSPCDITITIEGNGRKYGARVTTSERTTIEGQRENMKYMLEDMARRIVEEGAADSLFAPPAADLLVDDWGVEA